MVNASISPPIIDPAEVITQAVDEAWHRLCEAYDISCCVPEIDSLFEGLDLSDSEDAAEGLLATMLTEVIDLVSRFSPWYTKPARAFGLISFSGMSGGKTRWRLAPEAIQKWEVVLNILAEAIGMNRGLLQATLLVGRLMDADIQDDPFIVAGCLCQPKRRIRLRRSVMKHADLVCDTCNQPFRCES